MRNTTPPGQVSVRFRIGSGSPRRKRQPAGSGAFSRAHGFKGSTNVAEGEIIRILQRKGLAFGPDINAHTSYDETVYALDLPKVDADTVSTGLMLMRETASELTRCRRLRSRTRRHSVGGAAVRHAAVSRPARNHEFVARRPVCDHARPDRQNRHHQQCPVELVRDYYGPTTGPSGRR
ncbi:insulinase family protein [Rhizobium beringeri]